MEIWGTGLLGVPAVDGSMLLELDARNRAIDAIYQDIPTESGREYELSFYIRSRDQDHDSFGERVYVEWQGSTITETEHHANEWNTWTKVVLTLVGSGGVDRLTLSESDRNGANNGRGVLLDMIALYPV